MPKCKNDPTRKYKGTEHSPKGLGFCAHSMKVGAVKKGKDGNKWEVREVKNGSKRWMKVIENKKLEKMWKSLSNGKSVIFVYKDKSYKIKKTKTPHNKNVIDNGINNKNVIAILTASNSYDGYRELLSKAKNKSVNDVIKNYKKYFPYPFPQFEKKGFII